MDRTKRLELLLSLLIHACEDGIDDYGAQNAVCDLAKKALPDFDENEKVFHKYAYSENENELEMIISKFLDR